MAKRLIMIKKVRKELLLAIGSFSAFSNNKIRNTGGMRFAARCEPQKRNASREKNMVSPINTDSSWKPNTAATVDGNKNSRIPRIEIIEAENK